MKDIIVIGSGPAGLTAGLYALRAGKSVLVLEKETFGGQITFSPKVENFPGTMQISGNEFAEKLIDQVLSHGGEIELETVTQIVDNGITKTVITEDGTHDCKSVIIATGVRHKKLELDRENDYIGKGISYCAVCDGAFYKGKIVAVIGGGNSALQEAIFLSSECRKVYLIHRRNSFRADEKLVKMLQSRSNVEFILDSTITNLIGADELGAIEVTNVCTGIASSLEVDGLFVAIGHIPDNIAFSNISKLDENGYFTATENCLSETNGIFVAGDCRAKEVNQLTTAISDGSVSALAACKYIDALDN